MIVATETSLCHIRSIISQLQAICQIHFSSIIETRKITVQENDEQGAETRFFKPHHVVKMTHPSPWLLNEAREQLALVHPDESRKRYETSPLIDFDDIESQPTHNHGDVVVIHSFTPASVGDTDLWAKHKDFEDVAALLHDMKLAISGPGITELQATSFTR